MTLKIDVLATLGAIQPATGMQVFDKCQEAETAAQVIQALSTYKGEGLVDAAGKSDGADGRVMKLYRLTSAGSALIAAEKASGGGDGYPPKKPVRGSPASCARCAP